MKTVLQFLLRKITKKVIKKYNPFVIAITGSVGKTSTKEGVYSAFSHLKRTAKSGGNLNTEIGAPLVFLKQERAGQSIKEWFFILLKGLWILLKRDSNYPEVVVVELAADKPGDIQYLAGFIKPNVAVVTAVGDVPVHVEFYKSPGEVAREKEKLVAALPKEGVAVLNLDDPHVAKMKTGAKKLTFGFSKNADVIIKKINVESIKGSSIILGYKEKKFPIFLSGCVGDSFAYIAASVFAVGISLGIDCQKIPEMIERMRPSVGRQFIVMGKNETTIIDGSYNAAPPSMHSALKALKDLPGKRKIAVLGDMLELGTFSAEEHRKIGRSAAEFCDYIFTVGEWGEEVRKSAISRGAKEETVFAFSKSSQVLEKLGKILQQEDLVLIKGSQGIRMEKIVFGIMRDPERSEELLVRQEPHWKNK